MDSDLEALRERIESLEASRVALLIVNSALIATHPRHADFQLVLTAYAEKQLQPGSPYATVLTPEQVESVRSQVETLQRLGPIGERAPQKQLKRFLPPH